MRLRFLATSLLALIPVAAVAGPIYGTVRSGASPMPGAHIEVACPDFQPAAAHFVGQTDRLGSFRMNVAAQGRCVLRLNNQVSATIYLSNDPIRYDFTLVQTPGGLQLRRQ
jgi:hypothetical protein